MLRVVTVWCSGLLPVPDDAPVHIVASSSPRNLANSSRQTSLAEELKRLGLFDWDLP
ncbi:hypothetical protein VKT23_009009 [Stygiomarasmius scandens]|uniref:Uncharacterized protein n=1 Tax=Marasmiellus scandens TaxID=2682957 RepID=A0ABR1JKT9_9AGAR